MLSVSSFKLYLCYYKFIFTIFCDFFYLYIIYFKKKTNITCNFYDIRVDRTVYIMIDMLEDEALYALSNFVILSLSNIPVGIPQKHSLNWCVNTVAVASDIDRSYRQR